VALVERVVRELSPLLFVSMAGLAILWLAMLLVGTGVTDHRILLDLYAGHHALLADAAKLITMLGDGRFVIIVAGVAALVLAMRGWPWPALVFFAGTLFGRMLVEIQKFQIDRLRPAENPHLVEVYTQSFPSGHSANAAMTYVGLALFLVPDPSKRRKWLLAAVAVTFLVGISRVMLGVHWPTDVIGGWTFGLFWVLLLYTVAQRFEPGRARFRR
jgi:undecaprenyl-diphosphatase